MIDEKSAQFQLPLGPRAVNLGDDERLQILAKFTEEMQRRVAGHSTGKTGIAAVDLENQVNEEVTAKLQKEEKYVRFHEWSKKYGVKYPSVEYPVAFGARGDLIGVRAKRDINPNEAFVYVPVNLTLNEEQWRRGAIGEVYDKTLAEFQEEYEDPEHAILTFFVAYQMSLGPRSFWYPYFEVAAETDLPMEWNETDLGLMEDDKLMYQVLEAEDWVREEYDFALEIVKQYKYLIKEERYTYEVYKRAFKLVKTRAFGYSTPYLMVVPFADMFNHHCVDTRFDFYNHRLSSKALRNELSFDGHEEKYFTYCRAGIDFVKHFSEDDV